jgi:all-trans-retinol dehydrogenase (NAD+)
MNQAWSQAPKWAQFAAVATALYGATKLLTYQKPFEIQNQVVVITGGASGIGRLMALKLAKKGAKIAIWDRNAQGIDEVVTEIIAQGAEAKGYVCDVTNRELVYTLAKKVKEDLGVVDVLINNAGIVTGKKLLDCPDHLSEKTVQVNSIAHFWTLKAFLPDMIARDHGYIVTIASCAGLFGTNGLVDYCASKFAAVGIHESLQVELYSMGKKNIHLTCVCPAYISTGMFEGVSPLSFAAILEPDYVAERIIKAIKNKEPMLILPKIMEIFRIIQPIVPTSLVLLLSNLGNHCMETFVQTRDNA